MGNIVGGKNTKSPFMLLTQSTAQNALHIKCKHTHHKLEHHTEPNVAEFPKKDLPSCA